MESEPVAAGELLGREMHDLARELFPICRSLTGDGVRQTLKALQAVAPLAVHEVPSGTAAFDWTVPREWNVRDAYVADDQGNRVIDFRRNNLHLVGYSTPVDEWLTLEQLQPHLFSLEHQPDAIPYVTSYYSERWGFCLAHRERAALKPGRYRAVVDATLEPGHLTYGELIIPGESQSEVFVSSYVCHPSMANNELSGPIVSAFIARWLMSRPRRYTYRFVYSPETLGSLVYLSRNLSALKEGVVAGFNLSCIGDERGYSMVASRYADTLADRAARCVLHHTDPGHIEYSFLERGSDERQYCAPGIDLPLVTLCRSKFGRYAEYHTSLDDLTLVTPEGLQGGFELVQRCLQVLEGNRRYRVTTLGEPQLGKRNLYPSLSIRGSVDEEVRRMMNFIAYADGRNDLIEISRRIDAAPWLLLPIAEKLRSEGLFEEVG